MSEPKPLASAYDLPYRVRYSAPRPFSSGIPLTLRISAKRETADAVEEYATVVTAFAMLAATGALSGDRLPPEEAAGLECDQPLDHVAEWRLSGARLDDRALVVLAQLLTASHETHPIAEITCVADGGSASATLVCDPTLDDPYPPSIAGIPFTAILDPELEGDATISIDFARMLTPEEGEAVDAWIMAWAAVTMSGAYGVAPVPPADCGISCAEEVILFDDSLELPITAARAHPACWNGLVNACVALHALLVPIRELRIE